MAVAVAATATASNDSPRSRSTQRRSHALTGGSAQLSRNGFLRFDNNWLCPKVEADGGSARIGARLAERARRDEVATGSNPAAA